MYSHPGHKHVFTPHVFHSWESCHNSHLQSTTFTLSQPRGSGLDVKNIGLLYQFFYCLSFRHTSAIRKTLDINVSNMFTFRLEIAENTRGKKQNKTTCKPVQLLRVVRSDTDVFDQTDDNSSCTLYSHSLSALLQADITTSVHRMDFLSTERT